MVRCVIHFTGHVQGVGFRFTARQIAAAYRVSGYVENLDDGRVLLVAEGEAGEIDRYLRNLSDQMGRFIKSQTAARTQATGEFGTPGIDPLTIRR